MVILSLTFYIFYKDVKSVNKNILNISILFRAIDKSVLFVGTILIIISFLILSEILFNSYYYKSSLLPFTILPNFLSSLIFGIFSLKFFQWYKNNRESYVVLLFGLAFIIFCFSNIFVSVGDAYLISTHKSELIDPSTEVTYYDFEEGSFFNVYFDLYAFLDLGMFFCFYLGSILMLYPYSRKIGRTKFWLLMLIPLISQLFTLVDSFNIMDTDTDENLFYFYLVSIWEQALVGFLFGFVFWKISKQIDEDNPIRKYLRMVGLGFILFYISNQSSVFLSSYPPFGLLCLTMLTISAYFVVTGLYSSAISISQNLNLRKSIKKISLNDANFLSSIGKGEMEGTVKKTVSNLKNIINEQEKEMEEKTGIETQLSTNEMEDYLQQVVEETLKIRNKKKSN